MTLPMIEIVELEVEEIELTAYDERIVRGMQARVDDGAMTPEDVSDLLRGLTITGDNYL